VARRFVYPATPLQFGPDEAFLIVAIAAGGLVTAVEL